MNSHELVSYLRTHCIDRETGEIDADADDLIMAQAAADGFADFRGGHWYARGKIEPGERRHVRYIFGGELWIEG